METIKINIGGVITELDKSILSEGIEKGEVSISNDNIVVYEKDNFETFKTNLANQEYINGKTKGVEMAIKEAREKNGLEFEGKTMDNLLTAFKDKAISEAKVEPNQKIKGLETDFNSLQQNYTTLQADFESYKNQVAEEKETFKKENTLLSLIPDKGLIVDKDVALMALKSKTGIGVTFDESGNALQTVNGEIQKDSTLSPIKLSQDFITEKLGTIGLLEKPSGGQGKGDEPGGNGQSSYDAFVERMKTNNINEGSIEFNEQMQQEISSGTLKM